MPCERPRLTRWCHGPTSSFVELCHYKYSSRAPVFSFIWWRRPCRAKAIPTQTPSVAGNPATARFSIGKSKQPPSVSCCGEVSLSSVRCLIGARWDNGWGEPGYTARNGVGIVCGGLNERTGMCLVVLPSFAGARYGAGSVGVRRQGCEAL